MMDELLRSIINASGISGYEGEIAGIMGERTAKNL